jgi:hypothetical protein
MIQRRHGSRSKRSEKFSLHTSTATMRSSRVSRAVDLAHPSRTDQREDFVRANKFARGERQMAYRIRRVHPTGCGGGADSDCGEIGRGKGLLDRDSIRRSISLFHVLSMNIHTPVALST